MPQLRGVQVAWVDAAQPWKGFHYLYLTPEDARLAGDTVRTVAIEVDGSTRLRVTDIIGKTHGLGVENLRASGMIAGSCASVGAAECPACLSRTPVVGWTSMLLPFLLVHFHLSCRVPLMPRACLARHGCRGDVPRVRV